MSSEEVIELSVAETQALRARLGLPPLRGVPPAPSASAGAEREADVPAAAPPPSSAAPADGKEELSLSIDETNALRATIGLPPLRTSSDKPAGSSASTALHAPPPDAAAADEARKRVEDAAAKREAAERLRKFEEEAADEDRRGESAADFARRMMAGPSGKEEEGGGGEKPESGEKKKRKKKKKRRPAGNPQLSLPGDDEEEGEGEGSAYTSADLAGMKVSHAASEFQSGSTAVLTLADRSILEVDPESRKVTGLNASGGKDELVNASMDANAKARENLKAKRRIEMGAGRAGGYAGYDDDEFEELGGTGPAGGAGALGPSGAGGRAGEGGGKKAPRRGFAIGADGAVSAEDGGEEKTSDIFSSLSGGAVSLRSRHAGRIASDFLSHDVDEEGEGREEKLEKERAKQAKILEKLRKKDKKKAKKAKKKKRRERSESSDEEEGDEGAPAGGGSLLDSLEATAVAQEGRKRRRRDGDETVDGAGDAADVDKEGSSGHGEDVDEAAVRRERFDRIMEKGRARTDRAFKKPSVPPASGRDDDDDDAASDGEEDDAFLNAALAKARRVRRLKELAGAEGAVPKKGEEAVVRAVLKSKEEEEHNAAAKQAGGGSNNGGITFEFDEMQEFTRALRAREDQARRGGGAAAEKGRRGVKATVPGAKEAASKVVPSEERDVEGHVEDVDMEELAQEMEADDDARPDDADDDGEAFGSTASAAAVGRGMSGVLSLLRRTGEISKRAAREEMRGRAKDERTYDDYEELDLKKVVTVDARRRDAHEKDVELANREVKLEYRDDYGRLLTRKEAYRNMCYQFHGHGSSKKNQERRLRQIDREREEARAASGRGGTLGALRATQKATGKAFVIHKT
ncbi:hypothetical protein ACHAWF_018511 [Thalassiosira exigua]